MKRVLGKAFPMAFEEEEVTWIMEQLKKAMKLAGSLGFIQKFRGKSRTHLLEVYFNSRGRFIRIMEFVTSRKTTSLIVPEGVKGEGWEALRKSMSSVSECYFHSVNGTEERESLLCKNCRRGGYKERSSLTSWKEG